jgi:rod shape-determining protein MreC
LAACVLLSLVAIALPGEAREPIARALRRTIVAPLVGLEEGAERWRTAWSSSTARQTLVDSAARQRSTANALALENQQLRKLLGLGSRLQWGFVPAEAMHSTAPDEDIVTSLTITAGTNAGVAKYSAVVAPEGLVGVVKNADPTMSIVVLYTDPDFRASAMSADGSAFGIVYPHQGGVGTASAGGNNGGYLLELRGVPYRNQVKPGTLLYTSGLGGTFPRGITIGSVMRELTSAEGWTRTYLVRPAVSPAAISTVMVLTAQRVTQGTGNIWGAVVNADSASRSIAAAGDSVARQAALLEAQARRAALDSVRIATADSMRRVLGVPGAPDTTRRDVTGRPALDTTPRVRRAPAAAAPVVRDTIPVIHP